MSVMRQWKVKSAVMEGESCLDEDRKHVAEDKQTDNRHCNGRRGVRVWDVEGIAAADP